MAKSFQLKEIIGCDTGKSVAGKFTASPKKGEAKANPFQYSSAVQFLDELTLWKTALQIETFASGHSK